MTDDDVLGTGIACFKFDKKGLPKLKKAIKTYDTSYCEVLTNIKVFCNNYLKIYNSLQQDIVYMDPP